MLKHFFWGIVVLLVAVIVGYVALTITGHSDQASALGTSVMIALALGYMIWYANS